MHFLEASTGMGQNYQQNGLPAKRKVLPFRGTRNVPFSIIAVSVIGKAVADEVGGENTVADRVADSKDIGHHKIVHSCNGFA